MTRQSSQRTWTAAQVMALGVRTTVPIAGEILAGLCKDESYRMVQRGEFPVPVVKVGRRMVVPVAPILRLLSIEPDVTDRAPPEPEAEGRSPFSFRPAGSSASDGDAA